MTAVSDIAALVWIGVAAITLFNSIAALAWIARNDTAIGPWFAALMMTVLFAILIAGEASGGIDHATNSLGLCRSICLLALSFVVPWGGALCRGRQPKTTDDDLGFYDY